MNIFQVKFFTGKLFAVGFVIDGIIYAFTNNNSAREMLVVFAVLTFLAFFIGGLVRLIEGK